MSAVQPRLFGIEQTQTTSDDYYTAKWIFDALGLHFDLDVASPPHPTNVPCDRYYTQADDGLGSPWYGRVWMNPPFRGPDPGLIDGWPTETVSPSFPLARADGGMPYGERMPRWCRFQPTLLSSAAESGQMPAVLVAIGQENELALQ
jgi:hypothetical protein